MASEQTNRDESSTIDEPVLDRRDIPPGPKSQETLQRLLGNIGRANYTGLYGIALAHGDGIEVTDADGNTYLDFLAAASSCSVGYGRREVIDAYADAALEIQQTCLTYSPNDHASLLAERLRSLVPAQPDTRVLLGLSGSDSSGGAIKALRRFTDNMAVVHFKNDYHGSTGLSQAASDFGNLDEGLYRNGPNFIEVPFPKTPDESRQVLDQIDDILAKRQAGGVIGEAIQGDAGVQVPPEGFLTSLRDVTRHNDALLILDEVQSGMGRTGRWWAHEHEGIVPDLLVTAKGLGGGYAPISAVVGRADVLDSLDPGQHIFTYGGHPPSCAVACAVIDYIESHNLIDNASEIGSFLLQSLEAVKEEFPDIFVEVRGRGLMIGVEIDVSVSSIAGKVFATRCAELGAYVGFFGVAAQVVRVEPPLVISQAQAQRLVDIVIHVAHEFRNGTVPTQTYDNVKRYSIGI